MKLQITVFLLIGMISRLLPHAPNSTALGAVALVAGATLPSRWWAFAIPWVVLFLTDLVFSFHPTMWSVYIAAWIWTGLGVWLGRKSVAKILGASLVGSTIFFLLTNFAVWLQQPFYAKTSAGLLQAYVMALPFFEKQIFSDLVWTVIVFALSAAVSRVALRSSNSVRAVSK